MAPRFSNTASGLKKDLFHEEISQATIDLFFHRTADSHEPTEELLLKRILQSPAIHVDETKISILGVHQQVLGIQNKSFLGFLLSGLKNVEEYGGKRRWSSSATDLSRLTDSAGSGWQENSLWA
jgi:hypothetical protein